MKKLGWPQGFGHFLHPMVIFRCLSRHLFVLFLVLQALELTSNVKIRTGCYQRKSHWHHHRHFWCQKSIHSLPDVGIFISCFSFPPFGKFTLGFNNLSFISSSTLCYDLSTSNPLLSCPYSHCAFITHIFFLSAYQVLNPALFPDW